MTDWENDKYNTKIEIRTKRTKKRNKNIKVGKIITRNGGILCDARESTFKLVQKKLRDSGYVPTSLAINKNGNIYFNRIKKRA